MIKPEILILLSSGITFIIALIILGIKGKKWRMLKSLSRKTKDMESWLDTYRNDLDSLDILTASEIIERLEELQFNLTFDRENE